MAGKQTRPELGGCRADGLSGPALRVHRAVLATFALTGQPPARGELERLARGHGAEPGTGRVITVRADGDQARWDPRTTVVFAGSAGGAGRPSADRSCSFINFFATAGNARAWARRHPEVTGRLLTREAALRSGVAQFGTLLQAAPQPGLPQGMREPGLP